MSFLNFKNAKGVKFCEERKKGAKKIADQAALKGGVAELTAWHFNAKLPEYDACISALKENEDVNFFKDMLVELTAQLHEAKTQKAFQEIMGKMEVWGEVYLQVKA